MKTLVALGLAIVWPGPAHSASPMGASSSSTVQIRLSVAARMELSAVSDSNDPTAQSYCIGSNAGPPELPVYLIWADIEPPMSKPAGQDHRVEPSSPIEVSWCQGDPATAGAARNWGEARQAIIHPE